MWKVSRAWTQSSQHGLLPFFYIKDLQFAMCTDLDFYLHENSYSRSDTCWKIADMWCFNVVMDGCHRVNLALQNELHFNIFAQIKFVCVCGFVCMSECFRVWGGAVDVDVGHLSILPSSEVSFWLHVLTKTHAGNRNSIIHPKSNAGEWRSNRQCF